MLCMKLFTFDELCIRMSKFVQSSKEQGQQGTSVLSDVSQSPAESLQTHQNVSVK